MTSHLQLNGALGLPGLVAQAHRIATGHDVSLKQAGRYFQDPAELVRIIRQSGALRSQRKRTELAALLSACSQESSNGL
jgi:hypothetical protein